MTAETDPILAHLARQRAEHLAAGRLPEVQRVDQELIAVQTLARLADDRQAAVERDDQDAVAAIDAQAQFWVRQVDQEQLLAAAAADVPADAPASDAPSGPAAGDVPAGPTPARKPKSS